MTSLPLWVKRRHIGLCKNENLPTQKKIFYVNLNYVVVHFTQF